MPYITFPCVSGVGISVIVISVHLSGVGLSTAEKVATGVPFAVTVAEPIGLGVAEGL